MSIIIELLAALVIAFVITFVVYGVISTIFKYKAGKEMEDLIKRNRDFYDDDDYEDMY